MRVELEQAQAALDRVRHVADLIDAGAPWTASSSDTAARIRDAATVNDTRHAAAVTEGTEPEHLGGGANAEDCPALESGSPNSACSNGNHTSTSRVLHDASTTPPTENT